MTNEEIYLKVLAKMSSSFTSNQFANCLRKNGLNNIFITNGNMFLFLIKNCVQSESSKRIWYKKDSENKPTTQSLITNSSALTDEICISFLKSKRIYKIYRQDLTEL